MPTKLEDLLSHHVIFGMMFGGSILVLISFYGLTRKKFIFVWLAIFNFSFLIFNIKTNIHLTTYLNYIQHFIIFYSLFFFSVTTFQLMGCVYTNQNRSQFFCQLCSINLFFFSTTNLQHSHDTNKGKRKKKLTLLAVFMVSRALFRKTKFSITHQLNDNRQIISTNSIFMTFIVRCTVLLKPCQDRPNYSVDQTQKNQEPNRISGHFTYNKKENKTEY